MTLKKALYFYLKKDYNQCAKILKYLYYSCSFDPQVYYLGFLCFSKLKDRKKALKWLEFAYYQFPNNKKIAQSYAFFLLQWKKNTEEVLFPIEKLTSQKMPDTKDTFTHYLLSRFYYKRGDLEKAIFMIEAALLESDSSIFKDWYFFLVYKLRNQEAIDENRGEMFFKKIFADIKLNQFSLLKHPFSKLFFSIKKGAFIMDKSLIENEIFNKLYFDVFKRFLSDTPSTKMLILKANDLLKKENFYKKNSKNRGFFDENFLKIISALVLISLLYYLYKEVF